MQIMKRTDVTEMVVMAKIKKGLTWTKIAKAVGQSKEWTTAALLGQMQMTKAQASAAGKLLGLPADAVVYACFNRPEKITPAVFDCWLEILRQVPGSVLWIINDQPLVEQRLRARLATAGLEWRRLVFSPKLESAAFGQCCGLADLLLDTSPYGSGATAVTALAAGLPLLTCPGQTFASRMGASLCAATGLEELICPTPEAYRDRAIALGRQPAVLQLLRHKLLAGRAELPLFNTSAWVEHLEQLLEQLLKAGG